MRKTFGYLAHGGDELCAQNHHGDCGRQEAEGGKCLLIASASVY